MASARQDIQEIVFADEGNRFTLSKAVSRGTLRRISRGIYTRSRDDPAAVVRRNLWAIVGHEFPGAVISDRCARRLGPDETGLLTIVHARTRPMELPGLRIVPRKGAGPLRGDTALPFGLWGASTERAMLDNLAGTGERYLDDEALEAWIVDVAAQSNGARRLNTVRDRARQLAPALGRRRVIERLDALISAALATGPASAANSNALRAWAAGAPYDRTRIDRFSALAAALTDLAPEPLPALPADTSRRTPSATGFRRSFGSSRDQMTCSLPGRPKCRCEATIDPRRRCSSRCWTTPCGPRRISPEGARGRRSRSPDLKDGLGSAGRGRGAVRPARTI